MYIKAIIVSDLISQKNIDKLNLNSENCFYTLAKRIGYEPIPSEVLLVIFEFVKILTYNASYDLLKNSVLLLISKLKFKHIKGTRIMINLDNKTAELSFSFDVTDAQKEKLVDAAIKKLLGGNEEDL